MYAAVDLGSNSFRLHIGKHDGESIRVLKSMREPIRLAAGLDASGNLTEAAMQAALACLKSFRVALAAYQLDPLSVQQAITRTNVRGTSSGPVAGGVTTGLEAGSRLRTADDVRNIVVTSASARPVFVRIVSRLEITGTFKLRTQEL